MDVEDAGAARSEPGEWRERRRMRTSDAMWRPRRPASPGFLAMSPSPRKEDGDGMACDGPVSGVDHLTPVSTDLVHNKFPALFGS
eukprot:m.98094 g.98094  ORF g.98094 m.98094 type:complete len:85 (-) comp12419_c0_seq1:941-1195(-)